ncbi:hypothetical protein [Sanguibacter sp. Z1732]|uniref:hypothetical protein n=1 Tax=Sanguibacter sp. Z1732 TaxID=3435412 RepID=UPI003D9C881A
MGGRPPVELASPAGAIRPAARRESILAAMVERDWPVMLTNSARVRADPLRNNWNNSPAPVVRVASRTGWLMVSVNHEARGP